MLIIPYAIMATEMVTAAQRNASNLLTATNTCMMATLNLGYHPFERRIYMYISHYCV